MELEQAGIEKLHKAQIEGFAQELRTLEGSLASMLSARLVGKDKIVFLYDEDMKKFSAVEEAKALKLAATEAERDTIRQFFEMNRAARTKQEMLDLNALRNSHGWQGVFGEQFGQLLKGNEAALREWAESANQSLLMVKLSGIAVDQMFQDTFKNFNNAMGQNIAQAIVYSTSIGRGGRVFARIDRRSTITQAIFSSATGFLRLAQYDYVGAESAFTAAAMFGSIGLASAVAGRFIAPPQASSAASNAAAAASSGTSAASGSSAAVSPTAAAAATSRFQIIVNGPIIGASGIDELASMLNDAVKDRDVRLIATQVKQQTRATV